MHDKKSLVDLLNSYLAIEGILNSRVFSEDTKQKAYIALKLLNEQFAEIMEDYQRTESEHGKGKAA